jgi:site-specific DNA-methyltransferase (adenine-specific)
MLESGFYNMDCMNGMAQFPDKFFELAIVDPPYGINVSVGGCGSRTRKYDRSNAKRWDNNVPDANYWHELFRVSKNQIIWGMNYFDLPPLSGFIVWDKKQPDGVTFAQAEIAFCSIPQTSKIFRLSPIGQDNRIHQAQKPIALYKWLLTNYAHPGDKILDTHVGSASSLIACHQMGFEYWGFELDTDYYKAATERLNKVKAQVSMTELVEKPTIDQIKII